MRKPFVKNLGLKISAVMISLVLWFFVTSRGQSEISLDVPLEFKNMPNGLEMVTAGTKTVAVTVRGQERLMKNVRPSAVRAFADLDKAKKGENTVPITQDDIKLPYSLRLVSVQPASVRVRLDETASRVVSLRPVITGVPEQGYVVGSITLDPRGVTISGLKSEVKKTRELKTEVLDISGLNEDLSEEIGIDRSGTNLKTDIDKVRINITVTRKR